MILSTRGRTHRCHIRADRGICSDQIRLSALRDRLWDGIRRNFPQAVPNGHPVLAAIDRAPVNKVAQSICPESASSFVVLSN
jgi:hypothetical protein